jgi:pimeloyl-ACP methyl ester carboxylesterase
VLFMPSGLFAKWGGGLASAALLAGGVYLLGKWYAHLPRRHPRPRLHPPPENPPRAEMTPHAEVVLTPAQPPPHPVVRRGGFERAAAYLAGGLALTVGTFVGRRVLCRLLHAGDGRKPDVPRPDETRLLVRPDGTELYVEFHGPPDAPPIILTPGWGADTSAWCYVIRQLRGHFRLIAWDLPGLGRSSRAWDNDYSMERLACDLRAVLELAGRPAVLVGHSMGAMILLTFCRLFREDLPRLVSGLVLAHGTYTDPVRTSSSSGLYTALQKPFIEPLAYLTMVVSPVVWLLDWLSYLNGLVHLSVHANLFAGTESSEALNLTAGYVPRVSPGVYARGMLGMLHFDETATLRTIRVPTLVVVGDRDVTIVPEAGYRMHREVRGSRLVTLSPCRHMGLLERPREFSRAVGDFSADCAGKVVRSGAQGR